MGQPAEGEAQTVTARGTIVGTVAYMSPEQAEGSQAYKQQINLDADVILAGDPENRIFGSKIRSQPCAHPAGP